MRLRTQLSIIVLATLVITVVPVIGSVASAQSLIPDRGLGGGCNFVTGDIQAGCIVSYLQYLIQLVFMLIGAFFLLSIVIAGYQIVIGSVAGDREGGKERLKWAIFGFIISALSFFIIDFIISALSGGT